MNSHIRKTTTLATLAVLAAVALTACSSGQPDAKSSGSAGAGGALTPVKVVVSNGPDAAPVYLAAQDGTFKKEGLDVSVSLSQGSNTPAALLGGSSDIGFMNYVSVMSGISNGLPVKVVQEGSLGVSQLMGTAVSKNSPITSVADLAGKKIGIPNTGSIADLTIKTALAHAGVDPSSVTFVQVPVPNAISAMESGQVDASFLYGTSITDALAHGDRLIIDPYATLLPKFPLAGYVASDAWIAKNGATLTKFRTAIAQASKKLNADHALAAKVAKSYMTLTAAQANKLVIPIYQVDNDPQNMQKLVDLMVKWGFIKKALPSSSIYAR